MSRRRVPGSYGACTTCSVALVTHEVICGWVTFHLVRRTKSREWPPRRGSPLFLKATQRTKPLPVSNHVKESAPFHRPCQVPRPQDQDVTKTNPSRMDDKGFFIGSTSILTRIRSGVLLKSPLKPSTDNPRFRDKVRLAFSVEEPILLRLGDHPRIVQ